MKSVRNILSVTVLVLALIGMSQKTFAQQEQPEEEQAQPKIDVDGLKNIFGPLFERTTETISKDIGETKVRIQKTKNVEDQRSEIRSLLLRITSLMTTYAPSDVNLYMAYYLWEPIFMPYSLIGFKSQPDLSVSWLEHSKNPADFPEFNEPLKLIDSIATNFADTTVETTKDSQEALKLLNALSKAGPDTEPPQINFRSIMKKSLKKSPRNFSI